MVSIANVGQTDKMIRLVAGVLLAGLSFLGLGGMSSTIGVVALVIAVVLVVTGLFNFCPAYKLFGMSTSRKET